MKPQHPSIWGRIRHVVLLASLLLFVAGCANDQNDDEIRGLTEAYEEAQRAVLAGNYTRGIRIYEAILARYPFSELARQIQLQLMYAYYKSGKKELAISAAETFERENPIDPRVDYALYVRGLAYFAGEAGFLERRFNRDITERPPINVDQSYAAFRRLIERYPASEYAADAQQRLRYLKDRLSQYENHVADYYLRRGAYVAALNRAKGALEQYNGSKGNARSLRIMAAAYDELGMRDLAADTRRILAANYPGDQS
ncbi:MAG: outer membrane protein assembly factor BamD [Pseudomonadota bacterium]